MNKHIEWARKNLPFSLRLNNPSFRNKGHPSEFLVFENMMNNAFGYPMIMLEKSRYSPTGLYWKRNPDGVWARQRNEFLFADKRVLTLARLYMPVDYEVTKKII